jgi:hypothetical protein
MSQFGRRVRTAVNPVSTAATRWWCHSSLRHRLTGDGPTVGQWRLIRRGLAPGGPAADSPAERGNSAGARPSR